MTGCSADPYLSAFQYARGEVHGVEIPGLHHRAVSTYANIAIRWPRVRVGIRRSSFSPRRDIAYVQESLGSTWTTYQDISAPSARLIFFKEARGKSTRVYVDALYGTGIKNGLHGALDGLQHSPMAGTAILFYSVNLGREQRFQDLPTSGFCERSASM